VDAIVRLSALGDIIHTAIILQFLPKKVDWIVEEGFAEILEHNPHINSIKKVNLKSLKDNKLNIFSEYKKLKTFSYDRAIDFQGLIKSAIVSKIIAKKVIGRKDVRENLAKLFYDEKLNTSHHTIDRYRDMINQIYNLNISQDEFINHKPFLFYKNFNTREFFSNSKKNIVFIVGSTAKNRQYPTKKWIELVKNLKYENILIPFGNLEEEKIAFEIAENSNAKVLPKMNLDNLKALISNADLVIGNDTGPTYIGWANNIPTILLFGTTPISRIFENRTTKIIKSKTAKYLDKLDKEDYSINDIEVNEILEKMNEFK
jgi:heptosyltransferase-1